MQAPPNFSTNQLRYWADQIDQSRANVGSTFTTFCRALIAADELEDDERKKVHIHVQNRLTGKSTAGDDKGTRDFVESFRTVETSNNDFGQFVAIKNFIEEWEVKASEVMDDRDCSYHEGFKKGVEHVLEALKKLNNSPS